MSSVKEKLKKNELTIGSWLTIGSPVVAEVMANTNLEWLVIDLEHTSIDLSVTHQMIVAIQSRGKKVFVRVSKNEEVIIKRVLDMGADGIIVPMICSTVDAKMAIDFAKYPPIGKRGVGLFRAQKYGYGFSEYKANIDDIVVIAQIEHIDAVKEIEQIITTDGIDGIIIGPYDLSGSMGYPGEYNRDDVQEAITTIVNACKKHNVASGFHVIESEPTTMIKRIGEGCSILAYSVDFFFLADSINGGLKKIKERI